MKWENGMENTVYDEIKIYSEECIIETYARWLLNKIDAKEIHLFKSLIKYPFYAILKEDESRIGDARRLRDAFNDLSGNGIYETDDRITILELLVSFAIRIDNDFLDIGPGIIFFEMVSYLELSCPQTMMLKERLERFVYRTYDQNGMGGIFPLKNPEKNQREVPLWNQAMAFIHENKERLIN